MTTRVAGDRLAHRSLLAEYSSTGCGTKSGLEVAGLAYILGRYATSFPESAPSCTRDTLGEAIATLALKNVGDTACSTNSLGGTGFTTPGAGWGDSCTGACGAPEYWCADFATWVWAKSGATGIAKLDALAVSFLSYGTVKSAPAVGKPSSSTP